MKKQSNYKYRNWVFTWNCDEDNPFSVPTNVDLERFIKTIATDYAFQFEQGETAERYHWQGCFRSKIRTRHSTLLNQFKELGDISRLTIAKMEADFTTAVAYCTKEDTRTSDWYRGKPYLSTSLQRYEGDDVKFLNDRWTWYDWQNSLFEEIYQEDLQRFTIPDDRKIIWITDSQGNSGKSKFVKYISFNYPNVVKLSFGTAAQLRSSVVAAGPQKLYVLDIPRTLGKDDSLDSCLSVVEDIKNGYVVSSMYGNHNQLLFDPPHVVCFSNFAPEKEKLSQDRWSLRVIQPYGRKGFSYV